MNIQETCWKDRCNMPCVSRVLCFFILLFAFALGLILGAVFARIILSALAAIIVFAATMAAVIIALLIFRSCRCCRYDRED